MEILAHRGRASPDKLGNSENDFMSCYHLGVDWIEADACLTADKKVIIYHPGSTRPDLSKMTWQEIDNSIFKILDLNSFLMLLRAFRDIKCCLDIKQNSKELVRKLVENIIRTGMQDKIYLTAFQKNNRLFGIESDGQLLLQAKRICPKIKTHLIVTWPFNIAKLVQLYKPNAISLGWLLEPILVRLISRARFKILAGSRDLKRQIREVQKMNIKVWAGICNSSEDMRYFADLGVDGIMTDNSKILIDLAKN